MRTYCKTVLRRIFYHHLIHDRYTQSLTQEKMAHRLAMNPRTYSNLDQGKNCCSAVTLALYLIYVCEDPMDFLQELRKDLEKEAD